jgi:hypothetical protein
MKLSPLCWAAAFSAALPCRRALRRGPLAGTGAVPEGGTGGGVGGGAVVATLGGLARGGRARGGGFGLVSSSHRWRSWAMAHQPSEPSNFVVILFCFRALFNVLPKVICGHPVGRGWATQPVRIMRGSRSMDMRAMCPPHWRSRLW